MAGGKKARAQAATQRQGKKGNQPSKKAGAKARVASALQLDEATSKAFWTASLHREPPALRTSFGNYTVLNCVDRFAVTTSTTQDLLVFVPWCPGPLSAILATLSAAPSAATTVVQQVFSAYSSATPLALRPLRMSVELKCTGSATSAVGSVRVVSLDTSALMQWTTTATAAGFAQLTGATADSLRNLANDSLDTTEVSAMSLLDSHTYTSVPASYTAYNTYHDFVDFTNVVGGSALQSGDIFNLVVRPRTSTEYLASTTIPDEAWLGDVPPMRWFVFIFPSTPTAVTYRMQINRQDGARYPANSLGACFTQDSVSGTEAHESLLLRSIAAVSRRPSLPHPSGFLSDIGTRISSVVAGLGSGVAVARQGLATIAKAGQSYGKLATLL